MTIIVKSDDPDNPNYNTIQNYTYCKLTCSTLRTGSGNPTPPFQQGSELSTGNGLQSNKPGNTT